MEQQEQGKIIRELLQHRGWEIYQNLIQVWREGKKREQANFLRQFNPEAAQRAHFIQGEIDGSLYIMENLLQNFINGVPLEEEGEQNPAY